MSGFAKSVYVGAVRAVRRTLRAVGLLGTSETSGMFGGRTRRWLRSLFAIHDIDEMIRLDVAWWTFQAMDRVDAFLATRPNARVFEYGSGASTIWLARRCAHVTSVEHDTPWFELVQARLRDQQNVDLILRPPGVADPAFASEKPGWTELGFRDYVTEIDAHATGFDLIIIDGRARAACLAHAIPHLAKGGMILFDNSHRKRYRTAINGAGLTIERTRGLTVALPYPDETTLMAHDPATLRP